jgi:uncharacterized membrane protein YphA (DoxX/SURF4 family)
MISVGIRIYALGATALGIVGLVWDDFALVWQPVPKSLPQRPLLAYVFAAALTLAGLAANWRRTASGGATGLIMLFGLVVLLLHIPRALIHPQVFGAWSGLAEQLALLAAGVMAWALITGPGRQARAWLRIGQRAFACCLIVFGLAHFFYLHETAAMVPAWLPPDQTFWALLTGVAHVAAGIAILSGVQARLAAVLLTVMFALFGVLIHAQLLAAEPYSHLYWVMNAMNLALTGAAWVMADSLFARHLA